MKNKNGKIIVLNVQYYYDEDGTLVCKEDINSGISEEYEKQIDKKINEIGELIEKNTKSEKEKVDNQKQEIEKDLNDLKTMLEDFAKFLDEKKKEEK